MAKLKYATQQQLVNWVPPLNAVVITDLDGCAVDSSHRQHCNADGTLNLNDWREHSTPELINRDSLTLWGEKFRLYARLRPDVTRVVCTSRVLSDADYDFLSTRLKMRKNSGLIWSRSKDNVMPDHDLKQSLFVRKIDFTFSDLGLKEAYNYGRMFFVDDLEANCTVARNLGINSIQCL